MLKNSKMEYAASVLAPLAIVISEASCERSFCLQQLIHSKIRNSLRLDLVEAYMRIRFNKNVLFEEANQLGYEEGSDESDSVEITSAIQNLSRKSTWLITLTCIT